MYLKNTGFFFFFDYLIFYIVSYKNKIKKKTLNSRFIFSRAKFSSPHVYIEIQISETEKTKPCLYTKTASEGTNPESSS